MVTFLKEPERDGSAPASPAGVLVAWNRQNTLARRLLVKLRFLLHPVSSEFVEMFGVGASRVAICSARPKPRRLHHFYR